MAPNKILFKNIYTSLYFYGAGENKKRTLL